MDKTRSNRDRELSASEYQVQKQERQKLYAELVVKVSDRTRTLLQLPAALTN